MQQELTDAFRPTAGLEALRARAGVLTAVRDFFADRGVLEVETPVLCRAGAVERWVEPIPVDLDGGERRYLVASPEHSMKRLLAAGSGPIFQVARAFRQGERGPRHNPEFTILEWYRPAFDHHRLMDEVEALVAGVLGLDRPFRRTTYRQLFLETLGIDPFSASLDDLAARFSETGAVAPPGFESADRDAWLDLLLALVVEPALARTGPTFVTAYPASQASLARIDPGRPPTARRFELYVAGVELANGYHELADPVEQEARFEEANRQRVADGRPALPIDGRLLAALEAGLPDAAGVALGLDRLVLLAIGARSLDDVVAFPFERA